MPKSIGAPGRCISSPLYKTADFLDSTALPLLLPFLLDGFSGRHGNPKDAISNKGCTKKDSVFRKESYDGTGCEYDPYQGDINT